VFVRFAELDLHEPHLALVPSGGVTFVPASGRRIKSSPSIPVHVQSLKFKVDVDRFAP